MTPEYRARQLAWMKSFVRIEDGHWLWTGQRNFLGSPVARLGSGMLRSPQEVFAVLMRLPQAKGKERSCDRDGCVNPRHYGKSAPRRPQEPRSRPQSATRAQVPGEALEKPQRSSKGSQRSGYVSPCRTHCKNGHLLSETRVVSPGGRAYCGKCVELGLTRHGGGSSLKDFCLRGHDQKIHRERRRDGRTRCGECHRERAKLYREKARAGIH